MSESFQTKINALFAVAVASIQETQSLEGAWRAFTVFIQGAMRVVATELATYTGPQKRKVVLDLVGQLYDAVKGFVRLPIYLEPLRWFFGKQVVLYIAAGILEGIYSLHKGTING